MTSEAWALIAVAVFVVLVVCAIYLDPTTKPRIDTETTRHQDGLS